MMGAATGTMAVEALVLPPGLPSEMVKPPNFDMPPRLFGQAADWQPLNSLGLVACRPGQLASQNPGS